MAAAPLSSRDERRTRRKCTSPGPCPGPPACKHLWLHELGFLHLGFLHLCLWLLSRLRRLRRLREPSRRARRFSSSSSPSSPSKTSSPSSPWNSRGATVTVSTFFPTATPFACAFCSTSCPCRPPPPGPQCFLTDRFRIEGGGGDVRRRARRGGRDRAWRLSFGDSVRERKSVYFASTCRVSRTSPSFGHRRGDRAVVPKDLRVAVASSYAPAA